jgi:hypothetical protein
MDAGENADDRDDSIACTRAHTASIAQQTAAGSQMHRAGAPEGQQQQQLQGEAFLGVLIDGFQVPQVQRFHLSSHVFSATFVSSFSPCLFFCKTSPDLRLGALFGEPLRSLPGSASALTSDAPGSPEI